ncbi:hypothetical protein F2Q69_00023267 [Brassica cretica]|uniref:Uncharacterized protein n=1 Tax=Brassica cretica TaxID=69181 RepID=A0A8S9QKA9_BRACR|nr:hypothetical protein F2Q69_00023267 [Brassica cretica]
MEGSPYRKFSFSRGKGAVPGTGPGVLRSVEPGYLLVGTQRPVFCLGSGEIQYLSIFPNTDVFYRTLRQVLREQLRGQPSAENFAVYGRVAAGLVKVPEGFLVIIWISGPSIARRPALLRSGVDGVVMRSLGSKTLVPVMRVVKGVYRDSSSSRSILGAIANLRYLASRFPPLSAFAEFAPRPVLPVRPRR